MSKSRFVRRKGAFLAAVSVAMAATGGIADAASLTWNGGGGNDNLSTGANWVGGVGPAGGDDITLAGATRLTPANDIAGLSLTGIAFASGASSFNLGGPNAITLNGAITQNSANNQTISAGLVLESSTSTVNIGGAGTLSLGAVTYGAVAKSPNVSSLSFNNSASLTSLLVQTNSVSNNTLGIAAGQTLTINGGVTIGTLSAPTETGQITNLQSSGGGSLVVNGTTSNFILGVSRPNENPSTVDPVANFNAASLSNFTYTATTGEFRVGFGGNVSGTMTLANATTSATNTITAAAIRVADSNNQNNGNTTATVLALGQGTNALNATTFVVGSGKQAGQLNFQSGNGSVTLAGSTGGASTSAITVGSATSATGTNTVSLVDLTGHSATVQGGTVIAGRLAGGTGGAGAGTISFDTGTFNASSLQLGTDTSGTAANGARGVFNLGTSPASTGVLNVSTQFLLGNVSSANAAAKANIATFNINGGTANINADIVSVKNAGATGTTQTATLNLNGGTLNMNGKNIGTSALPITAVNLGGGTINGANRITATTTTLSGGVTIGGTPIFVIPDNGSINSTLPTFVVTGGIEGGGPLGPGTVNGNVQANSGARIAPGTSSDAGTLAFANDLSLTGGSIARFKLSPTVGSGNDQVTVGGNLTASGTVNVEVGILGAGPQAGNTYTLFSYGGTLTGNETNFAAPNLNSRTTYSIVPTASTPGLVQLAVGGSPSLALTWLGNVNNNWNLIGTSNFQDTVPSPQQFFNLDSVTFDDTSTNPNPVQVTGSLQPAGITVNAARNYTFAGTGAIAGNTGIVKQNSGTLVIANDNTFTGLTHIQNGTVQLGNGGTTGSVGGAIQNDANLVLSYSDSHAVPNAIAGGGTVTKNGANTLTLTGTSTYGGFTVVNGGTLQFSTIGNTGVASNLGGGPGGSNDITLNNGSTLKFIGAANATSNRAFAMSNAGATLDASPTVGAVSLTLNGAAPIAFTDGGPRTLTLAGTELTPLLIGTNQLALVISDQDSSTGKTSILKVGNNRWQLNSANSYSGGTTISAGGIRINNAGGFGTGDVSVANGAQAYLNAAGTVPNNFSIAGIGPAEAPGTESTGNFGALRVANVGANVTGTITLTADARITGRGAGAGGTLAGQITGAFALEFGNSGGGNGAVIIASPANNWTGDTTVSHGTLKGGAADVIPFGPARGNLIVNNSSTTFDSVFDLNGNNQQVNGLLATGADHTRAKVLNNAGGVATLTVGNNNAVSTFGGVIQHGTAGLALAKVGSGVLTLTGANTYVGGTTVSAGTLRVAGGGSIIGSIVNDATMQLRSNNTLGDIDGVGTTMVGDGVTGANVSANHVRQSAFNVTANSTVTINPDSLAPGVSVINSLGISPNGRLDLKDNKLITNNAPGTESGGIYSGVQGMVQAASNGGAWDQPGLTTSMPDAAGGLTSIGVATGEQILGLGPTDTATFAGQTISGASTVAMYTYAGDANMDGFISGDDYAAIDLNVAIPGADGWYNGDFNYDGIISGDDYAAIDLNIVIQGAPFFTSGGASGAGLTGVTAVPEPAGLAALAIVAGATFARRRRHYH